MTHYIPPGNLDSITGGDPGKFYLTLQGKRRLGRLWEGELLSPSEHDDLVVLVYIDEQRFNSQDSPIAGWARIGRLKSAFRRMFEAGLIERING